jgi:protein-tyrosine phosphatase
MRNLARILPAVISLPLLFACADAPQVVAEDSSTGFALYRSGRLSPADLGVLCSLGVEEILVLDGEGMERECLFQKEVCPGLRVRYNHAQEEDEPASIDFLQAFDAWIEEAQADGRKVAFRCRHGWPRTGRLAAYYRMRFEGASATQAIEEMQRIGSMMWRHPTLDPQVEAYADLISNRPCSTDARNCPSIEPDPGLFDDRFPADACGSGGATTPRNE